MTAFFNRDATPLITGVFIVSLSSGCALFFHARPTGFHPMQE